MSVSSQSGVFGFKRQGNVGDTASGPYNAQAANDVQQVTITGSPTGGNFKLTIPFFKGSETTGDIAYNAAASAVEAALEALPTVGVGDVSVSGATGGPWTVTFTNNLGAQNIPQMIGNGAGLTGGTNPGVSVTTVTDGGSWYWLPALNVNFQPNQIVQNIPPEVGGSLWLRGSYKGGVFGGGNVTMVPRAGLGLAELFHAFCGGEIIEGTSAADYNNKVINKLVGNGTNGVPTGAFKYRFIPDRVPGSELPWYTFIRNVGGKFIEQFGDGRLGNFAFDLAATGILQIDASFVSKNCGTIALTAGGTGNQQVGKQLAGNGPVFQMVDAVVKLAQNINGDPGPPIENIAYNPTRLSIGFMNELTQNEFVVGSHFLQDVTNLARTAQVTYGLYLRDAKIYSEVYAHGNMPADGSAGAAWDSEIWKGKLNVTLVSPGNISPSIAVPYTIVVDIPELDYQAAPINLAGNNLVEYQLSANVVLSQDVNVDPFTWEYITDEDIV